jgi:MFS family permease
MVSTDIEMAILPVLRREDIDLNPITRPLSHGEIIVREPTPDQEESAVSWKYYDFARGPLKFLGPTWYASPKVQLFIVAMICFLNPGIYNALGGLGAAGQFNASTADNANSALYATFAIVAFFAGTIVNVIGVRSSFLVGGFGYALYSGSFLYYSQTHSSVYPTVSGAILGASASLLWTAQGVVMVSYPDDAHKGRYFSWFWGIFNLGSVIGALVSSYLPHRILKNRPLTLDRSRLPSTLCKNQMLQLTMQLMASSLGSWVSDVFSEALYFQLNKSDERTTQRSL